MCTYSITLVIPIKNIILLDKKIEMNTLSP